MDHKQHFGYRKESPISKVPQCMLPMYLPSEGYHQRSLTRTYLHMYLPTYVPTYICTYLHMYLPTYVPTYIRHTYIHMVVTGTLNSLVQIQYNVKKKIVGNLLEIWQCIFTCIPLIQKSGKLFDPITHSHISQAFNFITQCCCKAD